MFDIVTRYNGKPPSVAITLALAEYENRGALEQPPLGHMIDVDALDELCQNSPMDGRLEVSFKTGRYTIRLWGDGRIWIRDHGLGDI